LPTYASTAFFKPPPIFFERRRVPPLLVSILDHRDRHLQGLCSIRDLPLSVQFLAAALPSSDIPFFAVLLNPADKFSREQVLFGLGGVVVVFWVLGGVFCCWGFGDVRFRRSPR